VIPAQFHGAGYFSHGLAPVEIPTGTTRIDNRDYDSDYRWGFIDVNGEVIVPPQFMKADSFSEGLAAVGIGKQYEYNAFIDTSGQVVIPPTFDSVCRFSEGLAKVEMVQRAETYGGLQRRSSFIRKSGELAFQGNFYSASPYSEGLACVSRGLKYGDYGYIDVKGTWVIQPTLASGRPFSSGIAAIKPTWCSWWMFMDKFGRLLGTSKPKEPKMFVDCFPEVGPFRCGVATVAIGFNGDDGYSDFRWKYVRRP
jgi:hypothetical protein